MKTVLEQLMELNEKLAKLEKEIMSVNTDEVECDGHCGCGCDEPPVEDNGPEFDSAGFSETDRVEDSQYVVTEDEKYVGHVHLTRVELIDFATRLTERVIESVKKAV